MVKINFPGGKIIFFPLVTHANFRAGYACSVTLSFDWLAFAVKMLLLWAPIRGKLRYLIGLRGLNSWTRELRARSSVWLASTIPISVIYLFNIPIPGPPLLLPRAVYHEHLVYTLLTPHSINPSEIAFLVCMVGLVGGCNYSKRTDLPIMMPPVLCARSLQQASAHLHNIMYSLNLWCQNVGRPE